MIVTSGGTEMAWVARVIVMHGKIGLWLGRGVGGGDFARMSVVHLENMHWHQQVSPVPAWEQVFGAPDFQINNRPEVIQLLPWYIKQVQDILLR